MKKFLLISLCLITLIGCREKEKNKFVEKTGKIIDKQYIPESFMTVMSVVNSGNTTVPVPIIITTPEEYFLKVSYTVNKKIKVSKKEYEEAVIGEDKNFLEAKN